MKEIKEGGKREKERERGWDYIGCRMVDRLVVRNNVKLNFRRGILVVWMRKG